MLQEIKWISQEEGEPQCRWFSDHDLDLIVWQEDDDIVSFQLCYGKTRDEYALIWQSPNEYSHNRVDTGPAHPGRPKPAPALVPDEHSSIAHVVHDFQLKSTTIEPELYEFIHRKLLKYEHARNTAKLAESFRFPLC